MRLNSSTSAGKGCKCGWGSCFPSPGISVRIGDWLVAKKNQNECPKDCTWGECHPQAGAFGDDCCKADYIYKCCEKPPPVLKGCQKKQSECPKNCTWGACHPHEGAIGDECCKAGYGFKCCEEAPKKERPCDLLKRKKCLKKWNPPCENCYHTSGKCFPSNGSRGDECCAADHELVCNLDMTHDQKMVADPSYAQFVHCAIQGHPDKETLTKCIPQQYRGSSEYDKIFGCQRALECLLRPHNSWSSLMICMPNDIGDRIQCAEPLPPTEEPPTTAQTSTPKSPVEIPIEIGGGGEKPYVAVLDVDNCTNMVKDLCACGQAWCVLRVGYSRTPCCPTDYDLVCCAKKAKAIDLVRMEFEVQGRLNETYETDMPTALTDSDNAPITTASPDSATTLCLRSAMTIYALSAAIAFLLMSITLPL
ncbi:hypothetical protein niasHT_012288 [Heterodera trifolii]|uniref:Uncharacterized protein n=1 Tax=Heterodera trifolii TaxID=157864 RepID=A0ABD2LE61_9BILA